MDAVESAYEVLSTQWMHTGPRAAFTRDSAVEQFLGAAGGFEPFRDVTVQFGNYFVNGFLPGRVSILAHPDGAEELPQCQAGHLQEPPWHLRRDGHQLTAPPGPRLPVTSANPTTPAPPASPPHLKVVPLVIMHVEGAEKL